MTCRPSSSSPLLLPLQLLFVAASIVSFSAALECIQCGPNDAWYSEVEHERRLEACRQGVIPATVCSNVTHTHCIVNWYRTGGSSEKIVTQRHCGVQSDVTGCTLYNSQISRKVRRHLLGRDDASATPPFRKETVMSFVEVCSTSCPSGECVNSSNLRRTYFVFIGLFVYVVCLLNAFF